jgi:TonB-dependent receptor
MSTHHRTLLRAASVAVLAFAWSAANAQTAPAPTPPADAAKEPTAVKEVVVTGIRASLRNALAQKRNSDEIVETISSKDIGVLPDVTIAEELDRLPGINTTTDRGNASQASLRGSGPRLVLGLLNGREIASSEPDRNVRWEIFPSESVGGVTVYKTQSADLIAGGVAGTIDIEGIKPLDYRGPELVMRAGPVYYDGVKLPDYGRLGYRGGIEIVHKFNDQVAIAVGASFQDQKNGYDSFQGWGYPTGSGVVAPYGAQTEADELTEDRAGFTTSLQWKPSGEFEVTLDALYSDVRISENQFQQWYGRNGGLAGTGASSIIDGDNAVVGGSAPYSSVTNVIAHYSENKTLLATGANAAWRTGDWKSTLDLSYSQAQRKDLWEGVETESYPALTTFNTSDGHAPYVQTFEGDGVTPVNPSAPGAQSLPSYNYPNQTNAYLPGEANPEQLSDALAAARLDFARTLHDGFFTQLSFGARVSDRIKSHNQDTYYEDALVPNLPAGMLSNFNASGFSVPPLLYGNFYQLAKVAYGGFNLNNANQAYSSGYPINVATDPGAVSAYWPQNYWRVREDDVEAYVKTDFAHDIGGIPMKGNAGIRVVDVWTGSQGYQSLDYGPFTPNDSDHHTQDILPSVNLNFSLTPDLKLRVGLARVMARPPLDEMRSEREISTMPPYNGTAGNPQLNPFRAYQADVSLEWYFHPESLLAASTYYKDVETNIGYKTQVEIINGQSYEITGPFNGNGGKMDGVEFTFQTPFYFLPSAFQHFGVYSNLALANSSIKEFSPTNNPLPQVGFAHTTAEADLWYSYAGLDTRLGYKFHSPYTVIYGWDASQLTRLESESTLDFSASYNIGTHYGVRFQAANLTDQVSRYYWNNDPNQLARYDHYGRRILLDFTFKY